MEGDDLRDKTTKEGVMRVKKFAWILAIAGVLVSAIPVFAQPYWPGPWMMGGYGPGACPHFGFWGAVPPNAQPISLERAVEIARQAVASYGNPDLILEEIMEFTRNFYVVVKEKSTGIGAFELLVDRFTGAVYPEPGPNMMWNTKYGHMVAWRGGYGMMGGFGWGPRWGYQAPTRITPPSAMPVTKEQAKQIANRYLATVMPGATAEDVHTFYGYYTIHVARGGKIVGMLSVNGYTGAVWYHYWHGDFIREKELD